MSYGTGMFFEDANDDDWVRANEDMRNDPERRAAIEAQIKRRQAVFTQARELLAQADALLRGLGPLSDDALVERCAQAVFRARIQMDGDARQILEEPTATYVGNKAAFGSPIGWTPNSKAKTS